MKKLTTESFVQRARDIHGDTYDYFQTVYINNKTKVCVICKIHGPFYVLPSNHIKKVNSCGCPECKKLKMSQSKRSNVAEFISKSKSVHGNKYTYDKVIYINNHTPVIITCPIHGDFLQTPHNHLRGEGCKKCANDQMSAVRKFSVEVFINRAKKIHGDKYNYGLITDLPKTKKIPIICPVHGVFYQNYHSHLKGMGCKKCANINNGLSARLSQDEVLHRFRQIHGDKYDYTKFQYVTEKEKGIIICKEHGEFLCNYTNHINGKGCPKCQLKSQSVLYERLKAHFNTEEIWFEVTNDKLPWIGNQRLDIFFPAKNIAIEFDGDQHYRPISFFGGINGLKLTQFRDKQKELKCKENNCVLLRIKYGYTSQDFENLILQIT